MPTKYDSLHNAISKTRGKAAIRFYDIVKNEPEEYSAFNDPGILGKDGDEWKRDEDFRNVKALGVVTYLFYSMQTSFRFFELGSTELKFFAQKFPILYYGMFRITVTELDRRAKLVFDMHKDTYRPRRPIKSIPYLKQAYHNVPNKFKPSFNDALLTYYRLLKSEREKLRG